MARTAGLAIERAGYADCRVMQNGDCGLRNSHVQCGAASLLGALRKPVVTLLVQGAMHSPVAYFVNLIAGASASHRKRYNRFFAEQFTATS